MFTDVQGSTSRWERTPQAMASAMQAHDDTVRAEIESRGGYVFKTVGDAFCAAFSRSADALEAAAAVQLALASADFSLVDGISVRIAVHIGESYERDGDYFGPTVNRAARLMSIGYGGQVLVSAAATEAARPTLSASMKLVPLGPHRLRDLTEPENVFQLECAGLRRDFPPLLSLDVLSDHNLPLVAGALIGRDAAVVDVKNLLGAGRLATIVGAGGVGKTRVALQVAADLVSESEAGPWFVDLARISDPKTIEMTLVSTLGLRTGSVMRPLDVAVEHLKKRRAVIVFDNCEHVVDEAARITSAIMRTCPLIRLLATSREALNVDGEQVFRLPPLARPAGTFDGPAEEALGYPAVELFAERARSVDQAFRMTDSLVPDVVNICERLDGIALAIELAAARVNVFQTSEIARQLDERFRLLTAGRRSVLPRQQTLRATIDWSYDLLSTNERVFFEQLAVFSGGWTLAAAEAVCGASLSREAIFESTVALVEKSLIVTVASDECTRYRFMESTRAYALEKLAASGDAPAVSRAHLLWVSDFARDVGAHRTRTIDPDLENIREALRFAERTRDFHVAAQIAGDLVTYWYVAGLIDEGLRPLETALQYLDADADADETARVCLRLAQLSSGARAKDYSLRAVALSERVENYEIMAKGYGQLAWLAFGTGDLQAAERASNQALVIWGAQSPASFEYASELDTRASILAALGRYNEARDAYAEASTLFERLGEEEGAAICRFNLAEFEFATGDVAEAVRLASAAAEVLRRLKSRARMANALTNLAGYQIAAGHIAAALESAREALHISLEFKVSTTAPTMEHIAAIAACCNDAYRAARLAGYVDAAYARLAFQRSPTESSSHHLLMDCLQRSLGRTEMEAHLARGARYGHEEAIAEALAVHAGA